MYTDALV